MEILQEKEQTILNSPPDPPRLDAGSCLNPLGPPESVKRAIIEALDRSAAYPDPRNTQFRRKLAAYHDVAPENIVCGGGAADLLRRLMIVLGPRKALLPVPTYGEFRLALEAAGCETERVFLRSEDGFALPADLPERITPETDCLLLCHPNSPTGQLIDQELLDRLLFRCVETGTLLLVDECFMDMVTSPARYSLVDRASDNRNLVILSSFTKTYAMAGLRIAYMICGSETLADKLRDLGDPWTISSAALEAASAALEESGYRKRTRSLLVLQKKRLTICLKRLGCEVYEGTANFLLFRCDDLTLGRKLRRSGVLVDDCGGVEGLGPGWYRVAVRTSEENGVLLRAIEDALLEGSIS